MEITDEEAHQIRNAMLKLSGDGGMKIHCEIKDEYPKAHDFYEQLTSIFVNSVSGIHNTFKH